MAAPLDPAAIPASLPHGSIQTTTSTAEAAPELLLTRGYAKRSLAALEPEFIDNNDMNGMAPSSSVLQSDFLIMDDAHNLDERFDMADTVHLSVAPVSTTSVPMEQLPPTKRARLGQDGISRPSASDFAQLEPIIEPGADKQTPTPPARQTLLTRARSRRMSANGVHRLFSRGGSTMAQGAAAMDQLAFDTKSLSVPTPARTSRRKSMADLVPPTGRHPSIFVQEDIQAAGVYDVPLDCSTARIGIEVVEERPPPPRPRSLSPPARPLPTATPITITQTPTDASASKTGTDSMQMDVDNPIAKTQPSGQHPLDASASSGTSQHNSKGNAQSATTGPAHRPVPPPLVPVQRRRSSVIFLPSPSHAHSNHHLGSCGSSTFSGEGNSLDHRRESIKKNIQRPVRIQLLDEAECESIREEARRASAADDEEDGQGLGSSQSTNALSTRHPSQHPPQPSASQHSLSQRQQQQQQKQKQKQQQSGATDGGYLYVDDHAVALPREDPIVHDWDQEELQDEESDSSTAASSRRPSRNHRSRENSSLRTKDSVSKKRKSIERDICRASTEGGNLGAVTMETFDSPAPSTVYTEGDDNDDDDDDDDYDDPLRDPERDIAVMSEDQEADSHNVHLRLETQREFQDAAGLDLGEEDAQARNEEGRYGGNIEDDDEGDDYWENR